MVSQKKQIGWPIGTKLPFHSNNPYSGKVPWSSGWRPGQRHLSKRVRTQVTLLDSLSKSFGKRLKPLGKAWTPLSTPNSYELNSTTSVFLEGWFWYWIIHEGWYDFKWNNQTKKKIPTCSSLRSKKVVTKWNTLGFVFGGLETWQVKNKNQHIESSIDWLAD